MSTTEPTPPVRDAAERAISEPAAVRWLLIGVAGAFLSLFLFLPLAAVFAQALERGVAAYLAVFRDEAARAAIRLTLLTAALAVPLNMLFGIAAAWAITKFDFRGKSVLTTLVDLPFAVSPVISGLIYILLFGRQGWLAPALDQLNANVDQLNAYLLSHGFHHPVPHLRIIFAVPGIVLATIFVTFPLVARELIPLMQAQGREEEEAAAVLGARGWQTFFRVTLPNIKWGLLYGLILCNARAMGEFGAVSVVSGHIRGLTNTMTLHVEILYNEYNFVGAFALASLLTALALVTLAVKSVVEWRVRRAAARQEPAFVDA